jgi:anti-sigma factor RsiW
MEITRDVILDLLPLYLANEASPDTNALVEKYLESDPELAEMARESAKMEFAGDTPAPLNQEDRMKAFKEAKRLMFLRTIILAAIISFSVIAILVFGVIAAAFLMR